MIEKMPGSRASCSRSMPRAMQDHLDGIGDALAPEAIGMPDPVGQRDGRVMGVEMARRRRNIRGLDRISRDEMHDVQALAELQEVAVIGEVSRPAAPVEIGDIGRAGDGAEIDVIAAEDQAALGIARMERDLRRHLGDMLHHHFAVEADAKPA